jgi:hypothetical protein
VTSLSCKYTGMLTVKSFRNFIATLCNSVYVLGKLFYVTTHIVIKVIKQVSSGGNMADFGGYT